MTEHRTATAEETQALAAKLARDLKAGDWVLLEGELGSGKTTFVRGLLEGLGWTEPVRSPTFNLIADYPTDPPVMHADLYRLASAEGIGLEDYLDSHLCLIEWPDRLHGMLEERQCWRISLSVTPQGRSIKISRPAA